MKVVKDNLSDVVRTINELIKREILVGVPEDTSERGDEITNASIGYINEYGSPAQNIPARPHLIPGVQDAQEKINIRMKSAAKSALDGGKQKAISIMESAGVVAVNSVKSKISEGNFIPLADATLKARARRGRKGAQAELDRRAQGEAPSTEDAKPLLDTGKYRNSITYVMREAK